MLSIPSISRRLPTTTTLHIISKFSKFSKSTSQIQHHFHTTSLKMTIPNRYHASHVSTNGPGDSRPTAAQIITDNNLTNALTGKVALVTGASSGIGIPTALALQSTGMLVLCCVRNIPKAESALSSHLKPGSLELIHLDNNSLSSVRSCAEKIRARTTTLNVMVNNAGIMATPKGYTADGHELQFGTNHLAHFLLFQLLKDLLLESASPEFPSRVVNVSSTGHRGGEIHFDDLKLDGEGVYAPWSAYGQSKLANIYMANAIERRYGSRNLHAFSLHPGGIWTGLQDFIPKEQMEMWQKIEGMREYMKSAEQGAATSVWAAVGKELEGKGGLYLEDCGIGEEVKEGYGQLDQGYVGLAFDEAKEERLWGVSNGLVGVTE